MNCFELSVFADMEEKRLKVFNDRFKTAAFAVVSGHGSNAFMVSVIYDHNLNPIDKFIGVNGINNLTEFEHTASNLRVTSSYPSSSTNIGSGTSISGHLGHAVVQAGWSKDRGASATTTISTSSVSAQRDVGTISNSKSPSIAIFMRGNKYWIGPRKMTTTPESRMGYASDLPVLGTDEKYGSIGFNDKTGQLAILEPNAAGSQFRLVTWENLSSPQNFDSSEDFFSQDGITTAAALTTNWFNLPQGTPTYKEDKRRAVVVVCDNGDILCSKMLPHHGFCTFKIEKSGSSYVTPTANIFWHHWTTTYGCEQGDLYGIKHRVTLDGKYIVTYAPTYYYGSGIRLSMIRVSDGKVLSLSIHDSHYGFSLVPVGPSDFIMTWSNNSDSGNGVRYYNLDMANQFETKNSGDTLDKGTVIVHAIDSGYYSTNYPIIVPILDEELEIFKAGETE